MIVLKYAIFAGLATGLNLFCQYLSMTVYHGRFDLYVAMGFGTLAGLVAKYVLDKKYVFCHIPLNRRDDLKKFVLYSIMGLATTILFWGTEIAFDALLALDGAMYLGATAGLTFGYISKYFLDKRFVFRTDS